MVLELVGPAQPSLLHLPQHAKHLRPDLKVLCVELQEHEGDCQVISIFSVVIFEDPLDLAKDLVGVLLDVLGAHRFQLLYRLSKAIPTLLLRS